MIVDPVIAMRETPWYRISQAAAQEEVAEVFIYDTISWYGVSAKQFVKDITDIKAKTIKLRINSPGGSVFDGLAIYNALRRHSARVEVLVEGLAASIASIIALAGDVVEMAEASFMMIHQPWALMIGNAKELRKWADELDKIAEASVRIYQKKTGLSRERVIELMDAETWMSSDQAVKDGFADRVVEDATKDNDGSEQSARHDVSGFRNPPQEYTEPPATDEPATDDGEDTSSPEPVEELEEVVINQQDEDMQRRRLAIQREKLALERHITNRRVSG